MSASSILVESLALDYLIIDTHPGLNEETLLSLVISNSLIDVMRLLSTLATSMGVALENARLFDETNRLLMESRQRTAEMETVNRISMAIRAALDINDLLQLVGEQMRTANSPQEDVRAIDFAGSPGARRHSPSSLDALR